VNFTVSQKGLPYASAPTPAGDFTGTQTDAEGRVFFNAKPKPGRWSTGHAAALFVHTDLYQSPLPPFSSEEGGLIMKATTGRYTRAFNIARLDITGEVTSVSGRQYPDKGEIQDGDKAYFNLESDLPTHQHDFLRLNVQCGLCGPFKGEQHFHK